MFLLSLFLLPEEKKPVALPRSQEGRVPTSSIQKLIEEITPLYRPEVIQEFKEKVADKANEAQKEAFKRELASKPRMKIQMKIKEGQKGLKGIVQSFELENIITNDPRMLFSTSQNSLTKKLAELLQKEGPFKAYFTAGVELKEVLLKMEKSFSNSLNPILTLQQELF